MTNLRPGWALTFTLILYMALSGCGKTEKSTTPAVLPTPVATESITGPEAEQAAAPSSDSQIATPAAGPAQRQAGQVQVTPVVIGNGADLSATLAQLTQAVRKYSFERRRMPKTLDEVVAAGYVSGMPNPPAGQKFALEPKNVEVVLTKR
jgi:hypothetical protein